MTDPTPPADPVATFVGRLATLCGGGLGLVNAFPRALDELPGLSPEVQEHLEEISRRLQRGPDPDRVLQELGTRVGHSDLQLLGMTLLLARRVGLPLVELLQHLAADLEGRDHGTVLAGQWPSLLHAVGLLTGAGMEPAKAVAAIRSLAPHPGRQALKEVLARLEKGQPLTAALEI